MPGIMIVWINGRHYVIPLVADARFFRDVALFS
jgi:hypothetical protein